MYILYNFMYSVDVLIRVGKSDFFVQIGVLSAIWGVWPSWGITIFLLCTVHLILVKSNQILIAYFLIGLQTILLLWGVNWRSFETGFINQKNMPIRN